MARTIEFLRSSFVPDFAECTADVFIADETVHCNNSAVMRVSIDCVEGYVCHHHLTLLCKEKWPITKTARNQSTYQENL